MIRDFDMVALTRDFEAYGLQKGDIGAVVHKYGQDAFEVEFMTNCSGINTQERRHPSASREGNLACPRDFTSCPRQASLVICICFAPRASVGSSDPEP